MNLNEVSKIRGFLFKIFTVSTNMVKIKIQLSYSVIKLLFLENFTPVLQIDMRETNS